MELIARRTVLEQSGRRCRAGASIQVFDAIARAVVNVINVLTECKRIQKCPRKCLCPITFGNSSGAITPQPKASVQVAGLSLHKRETVTPPLNGTAFLLSPFLSCHLLLQK